MRAYVAVEWAVAAGWLLMLAIAPWWLGLPLLLGIAAALLADVERLRIHAWVLRLSLRWGLPGVVFALKRWLGGDALAWTIAAVAALVGFTLLAGLESWLDRHLRRERADADADSEASVEWPELALAQPRAGGGIIELEPVHWLPQAELLADPRGGHVRHLSQQDHFSGYLFDDGTRLEAAAGRCAFSPRGRWFALESSSGVLLWDRDRSALHRLRKLSLCGWHAEQPWLQKHATAMPEPLSSAVDDGEPSSTS